MADGVWMLTWATPLAAVNTVACCARGALGSATMLLTSGATVCASTLEVPTEQNKYTHPKAIKTPI